MYHVNLCFWGFPRSLQYTIQSIENNILSPLENFQKNKKCTYAIYANFNTTEKLYTNPRAFEKNPSKINLKNIFLLKNAQITTQDQDYVVDKLHPAEKYNSKGNPWGTEFPMTFQNHIRSLYSLQEVYNLALQNKSPNSQITTVYIFARPDVLFLQTLPVDLLQEASRDSKFIATPSFANENIHLNDRFAICGSEAAEVYAKRIDSAENFSKTNVLHSETFLGIICRKANLNVNQFNNFFFQRIRVDGSVCPYDTYMTK